MTSNENIERLKEQLYDKSLLPETRLQIIKNLSRLSISQPRALTILQEALADHFDTHARNWIISELEKKGLLIPSIPALLHASEDHQMLSVRQAAEYALGNSIIELVTLLEDEPERFDEAKKYLELIGFDFIKNQLSSFEKNLTYDVYDIEERQKAAISALTQIDPHQSLNTLRQILDKTQNSNLAKFTLTSLNNIRSQVGDETIVELVGKRVVEDVNEDIRKLAAKILQRLKLDSSLTYLTPGLISDSRREVRRAITQALKVSGSWEQKTESIIENLESSEKDRDNIDARQIIDAINFSGENTNEYALTDYLIRKTVESYSDNLSAPDRKQYRMTAIMASLIIASSGESISLANERLDEYKRNSEQIESSLRMLRRELNPVLRALQYNLEANFQIPINSLNSQTKDMWVQTINQARHGFIIRVMMSIITFGIGIFLVVSSGIIILFKGGDPTQLWGPGISFAAGIVSMLLTVFRGPLKEIRQSVSDLGIANAAFTAYIHRVLQVSLTFSYKYLYQSIELEDMEKLSKLMQNTMESTIGQLNTRESKNSTE